MAAADGKSDNGRRGAPSLEKKENLKPRFSGPNPRSKTTFWTKSKEHDNNNKQDIKIKSIGSIEGFSVSVFQRERKLNGKLILNFWVDKAITYVVSNHKNNCCDLTLYSHEIQCQITLCS